MRAEWILQRTFEKDLGVVHLARIRLLFAATFSLLSSGRLSLTSLGRAIARGTSPKHGIKRIDRLLGNPRLHAERIVFYRAIARRLIAPGSRPVLIVDWTAVTTTLWALVAAVSVEGRALIIYAETHGIESYLKPQVNKGFIEQLKAVLPKCRPVVLTDAGFRSPWMNLVLAQGWDYVGRIRGLAKLRRCARESWSDIEQLWIATGSKAVDHGTFEIGRTAHFFTRVVGIRKKLRYQRRPGKRDYGTERAKRSAREPWILATSLTLSASKVVKLYSLRMQIEETFRDAKSHRFGICMGEARTRSPNRANLLLLLAAFAEVLYVLLGRAAEEHRLQLKYQANTTTDRRVLSLTMLGRLVFAQHAGHLLASALRGPSLRALRATIASHFLA